MFITNMKNILWDDGAMVKNLIPQCGCRNPSFGLVTKARGCKVASQKEGSSGVKAKALEECGPRESPGITTHSWEFKEVRGSVRE
jgi:hypothetical protein